MYPTCVVYLLEISFSISFLNPCTTKNTYQPIANTCEYLSVSFIICWSIPEIKIIVFNWNILLVIDRQNKSVIDNAINNNKILVMTFSSIQSHNFYYHFVLLINLMCQHYLFLVLFWLKCWVYVIYMHIKNG